MLRTARNKRTPRTPALRGLLNALLAIAYLFAGFAGEISCAGETLAIASASVASSYEVNGTIEKADQSSKKAPAVVEHCYTCVPLLVPAPVLVAEPSADPVRLSFGAPTLLLEDHPEIDTPPPKQLV